MLASLKRIIPIGWHNYFRFLKSGTGNTAFTDADLPGIFSGIYRTNHWKGVDSTCGITSGVAQTAALRRSLQQWLSAYDIKSITDVPCGDFICMKEIDLSGVFYTGGDILEEMIRKNARQYASSSISFTTTDITKNDIPRADLILCRDCFVHLSFENIRLALTRFKESGSRYLACTSFIRNKFNYDIPDGNWRTLNMQMAPFHFRPLLAVIHDECTPGNGVFSDKSLFIWKLSDI